MGRIQRTGELLGREDWGLSTGGAMHFNMKSSNLFNDCKIHELISRRIYPLLSRSFRLISNVDENNYLEALRIIKNDVHEISKIFNENSEIFMEPSFPNQTKINSINGTLLKVSNLDIQVKSEITDCNINRMFYMRREMLCLISV